MYDWGRFRPDAVKRFFELGGRREWRVPWDFVRQHYENPFRREREAVVDTFLGVEPAQRRRKTWKQVYQENNTIVFNLLSLGIRKEDVIVTQLPNIIENYYASIFTSKLSTVYPCLQVELGEAETKATLERINPDVAIIAPSHHGRDIARWYLEYQQEHPNLKYVFVVIKPVESVPEGTRPFSDLLDQKVLSKYTEEDLSLLPTSSLEPQMVVPSGGTTGIPKLTISSMQSLGSQATLAWVDKMSITPYDTLLEFGPINGGTGRFMGVLCSIVSGAKQVYLTEFDEEAACRLCEEECVTKWVGLPPQMIRTLTSPYFEKYDTHWLNTVGYAGAPLPPEIGEKLWDMGIKPLGSYGAMTANCCTMAVPAAATKEVCIYTNGRCNEGGEMIIVDAQGNRLPPGEYGEVWMRGINYGFYNSPELNESEFDENMWQHSGDVGVMDEQGNIKIVGRIKDMILRGGANIFPKEIEDVLDEHPKVRQSAVVAMPDPVLGERVCAYIVPVVGEKITLEELTKYLEGKGVTKFKWPERLELIDKMPESTGGKILKEALREDIRRKMQAEGKT